MKTPNMAGFIGHNGIAVWLEPSQQYEDDAAMVQDRPDLFDDVPVPDEPVRRGPGRPKGSTNKPHVVD